MQGKLCWYWIPPAAMLNASTRATAGSTVGKFRTTRSGPAAAPALPGSSTSSCGTPELPQSQASARGLGRGRSHRWRSTGGLHGRKQCAEHACRSKGQQRRRGGQCSAQAPELRARELLEQSAEPADEVVGGKQMQEIHAQHRARDRLGRSAREQRQPDGQHVRKADAVHDFESEPPADTRFVSAGGDGRCRHERELAGETEHETPRALFYFFLLPLCFFAPLTST